jgi:hypothetical protein
MPTITRIRRWGVGVVHRVPVEQLLICCRQDWCRVGQSLAQSSAAPVAVPGVPEMPELEWQSVFPAACRARVVTLADGGLGGGL